MAQEWAVEAALVSWSAMTTVIAFDVNETLLDLSAFDPAFEELLGSRCPSRIVVRTNASVVLRRRPVG
jgi:hypothetical protein